MKTLIQTFLFLFFLNSVFAQPHYHDYNPDQASIIPQLLKNKAFLKTNGLPEHQVDYYIPIVFQLIADTDGNGRVADENAYDLLCRLNEYFNPGDITFYLKEPPIHVDNQMLFNDLAANSSRAIVNLIKKDSAINFFVVDDIDTPSAPAKITSFTTGEWLGISKDGVIDFPEIIAQNLGFQFNLLNTFYGWTNFNPFDRPTWIKAAEEDYLGRPTEYMDGTNCDIGGDLVCDTPPDYYPNLFIQECEYKDSFMDPACVLIEPMVNNIMGNYVRCDNYEFTQGQFDLIKADLEINERGIIYQNTAPQAIGIPTRPQPLFPANVITPIVANQVLFDWEDAPTTATYILEISTNRFFNPILQTISTFDSELFVQNLEPNREYHWRVTAVSNTGCNSVSSEVSFETSEVSSSEDFFFEEKALTIFPNPIKGNLILGKFNTSKAQQVEIKLSQVDGKIIDQQLLYFHQGENQFSISADLPNGISILEIKTLDGTFVEKIILK